jgi:hypothetical protein
MIALLSSQTFSMNMRVSLPDVIIGIVIGMAVVAIFAIIVLQPRPGNKGELLVIGGYAKDISESTFALSQNLYGKIDTPVIKDCIDYCGENVIYAKVTYDTVVHGCGVQDGLDVKSCRDSLGKIPNDESVCGYFRLVDGELYAAQIFLKQTCTSTPQIS